MPLIDLQFLGTFHLFRSFWQLTIFALVLVPHSLLPNHRKIDSTLLDPLMTKLHRITDRAAHHVIYQFARKKTSYSVTETPSNPGLVGITLTHVFPGKIGR